MATKTNVAHKSMWQFEDIALQSKKASALIADAQEAVISGEQMQAVATLSRLSFIVSDIHVRAGM